MDSTKILMVCLGNICRSPLAQGILESKIFSNIWVDSAGTAAYHIGNHPDPRSIAVAKKHGIDISAFRARQFTSEDFKNFSHIYVMDLSNYSNVLALASNLEEKEKVQLILPNNSEVPDPYYGGDESFDHCFNLLNEACDQILKKLNHEK
jgi:protein-tyrosine phosphatase